MGKAALENIRNSSRRPSGYANGLWSLYLMGTGEVVLVYLLQNGPPVKLVTGQIERN